MPPEKSETFPGPVPPGHRVIVTVTSRDADGNKANINGTFMYSRDDDGLINSKPIEDNCVWDLWIDPPSDITHDTTVSVMDSDNAPADQFTVDWDGPVVVPEAVGFGFSIRTMEMPSTNPENTATKKK